MYHSLGLPQVQNNHPPDMPGEIRWSRFVKSCPPFQNVAVQHLNVYFNESSRSTCIPLKFLRSEYDGHAHINTYLKPES
jgi:hypothetical protein